MEPQTPKLQLHHCGVQGQESLLSLPYYVSGQSARVASSTSPVAGTSTSSAESPLPTLAAVLPASAVHSSLFQRGIVNPYAIARQTRVLAKDTAWNDVTVVEHPWLTRTQSTVPPPVDPAVADTPLQPRRRLRQKRTPPAAVQQTAAKVIVNWPLRKKAARMRDSEFTKTSDPYDGLKFKEAFADKVQSFYSLSQDVQQPWLTLAAVSKDVAQAAVVSGSHENAGGKLVDAGKCGKRNSEDVLAGGVLMTWNGS